MRAAWVQGLLGQGVCYAVCVPHDVTRLAVGLYPMALAAARTPVTTMRCVRGVSLGEHYPTHYDHARCAGYGGYGTGHAG